MKREQQALEGNEKINKTERERQKSLLRSSISHRDHCTSVPAVQPASDIISRLQHPLWNMLHPPPKSINIDSAFEQACVSTQVEPNDFETAQRAHTPKRTLKHISWLTPTKLKWMNADESAKKGMQFQAEPWSVASRHKKPYESGSTLPFMFAVLDFNSETCRKSGNEERARYTDGLVVFCP